MTVEAEPRSRRAGVRWSSIGAAAVVLVGPTLTAGTFLSITAHADCQDYGPDDCIPSLELFVAAAIGIVVFTWIVQRLTRGVA